jgi:hypothetical protein
MLMVFQIFRFVKPLIKLFLKGPLATRMFQSFVIILHVGWYKKSKYRGSLLNPLHGCPRC